MITFDPDKDATNKAKHGVSLADAGLIDWDAALIWEDERKGYGETRLLALAPIDVRLFCCVYVERDDLKRIISLRKANKREVIDYAAND
jgi:uncharacterized DUF497 family protein